MKRYADMISGGSIIIIAVVMLYQTTNIRALGIMDFGPELIPRMLSTALLLAGIGIFCTGLSANRGKRANGNSETKDLTDYRRTALTAGLITFYIGALQFIGFIITTVLYLFFQFMVLGGTAKKKMPLYAALAVSFTFGIYYLFYSVFSVLLPPGLLY
jgi:hypothetical protein